MIRRPPRSTLLSLHDARSDLLGLLGGDRGADDAGVVEQRRRDHRGTDVDQDRKSTRLNSSHVEISYAVFCLKKKKKKQYHIVIINESKYRFCALVVSNTTLM